MSTDANTITDEQVAEIADRQVRDGHNVTPLTIGSEMPDVSVVAIAAALHRWREARQPASAATQVRSALPDELSESLTSAAKRLWSSAQEGVERAMNQRLGTVQSHLDATMNERDEALAGYERAHGDLRAAREAVIAQTNALNAAESASAALSQHLAAANARAEAAEARETQLTEQIAQGEAALTQMRAAFDEERQTSAAKLANLNSDIAHAGAALEEERRAHEATAAQMAQRHEEIARLTFERDEARQLAGTLEDDNRLKSSEVQRLTQEASGATEHAEAATARAEAATIQFDESIARIAALDAELANAHSALAAEREASAASGEAAVAQASELQRIKRELEDARVARSEETAAQASELQRINRELEEARTHASELQQVRRELEEAREQIHGLNDAKATAAEILSRATQEAADAAARAEAAEHKAAQSEQRLEEQQQEHAQERQRHQQALIEAGESANAEEVETLQRQMTTQAKAYEKALYELRTNAEQWVAHSRELKQRLNAASERILFIDARSNGEVALLRRVSSELERLKPDHELISRDAQQKLISATVAERLAQKGYSYDPATAAMTKLES